jgi:hypothetical protein
MVDCRCIADEMSSTTACSKTPLTPMRAELLQFYDNWPTRFTMA